MSEGLAGFELEELSETMGHALITWIVRPFIRCRGFRQW